MNSKFLMVGLAGVAAIASVTPAAANSHKHHSMSGGQYQSPAQPIPYTQLGNYLKASPSQRAQIIAQAGSTGGGMSSSGMSGGSASTAPDTSVAPTPSATTPSAPAMPDSTPGATPGSTSNPAQDATPNSTMPPAAGPSPQ